jgi:hypothetical protein
LFGKEMNATKLENAILDYVMRHNDDKELRDQISRIQVASREHTGVGLYVNFDSVDRPSTMKIANPRQPYSGPNIESESLDFGAGSVVWCGDDGYLSCIEIFSYSDHYPSEEFDFILTSDDENPEQPQAEQADAGNRAKPGA